jgi:hypothetical protein
MHTRIGSGLGEQLAAPAIDLLWHHIMPAGNLRNAEPARRRLLKDLQLVLFGPPATARPVTISIRALGHIAPSLSTN